jgi:hypothetical protein
MRHHPRLHRFTPRLRLLILAGGLLLALGPLSQLAAGAGLAHARGIPAVFAAAPTAPLPPDPC